MKCRKFVPTNKFCEEKRNMRKLFVLLSLLVAVSMLLTACGPSTTPTAQPGTSSTQAPTTSGAPTSKDPTTLILADPDTRIDTLEHALAHDTASGQVIRNEC